MKSYTINENPNFFKCKEKVEEKEGHIIEENIYSLNTQRLSVIEDKDITDQVKEEDNTNPTETISTSPPNIETNIDDISDNELKDIHPTIPIAKEEDNESNQISRSNNDHSSNFGNAVIV